MERTVHGLKAADDQAVSVLKRVKIGEVVRCEVSSPRNLAFHRKFWALLTKVWECSGDWSSPYALLIELKVNVGHVSRATIRQTGEIVYVPRSISFAAMSEEQFTEFYEKCLAKLCEMAGGIEIEALRDEVISELSRA